MTGIQISDQYSETGNAELMRWRCKWLKETCHLQNCITLLAKAFYMGMICKRKMCRTGLFSLEWSVMNASLPSTTVYIDHLTEAITLIEERARISWMQWLKQASMLPSPFERKSESPSLHALVVYTRACVTDLLVHPPPTPPYVVTYIGRGTLCPEAVVLPATSATRGVDSACRSKLPGSPHRCVLHTQWLVCSVCLCVCEVGGRC